MTDVECQTQLGQARSDLMQRYKRMVDVLLAQADLTNTNDMATLQAFVTTLVSNLPLHLAGCDVLRNSLSPYSHALAIGRFLFDVCRGDVHCRTNAAAITFVDCDDTLREELGSLTFRRSQYASVTTAADLGP